VEQSVARLQIASDDHPYLAAGSRSTFGEAVERLRSDPTVRVVLLVGGERCFCAGASRQSLLRPSAAADVPEYVAALPRLLLSIPVPTVAAMAGHAVGGGLLLGLWCDVAVLAEESLYGANFVALGFTPGMGATAALAEWVGAPLARELLYTGRLMKGRALKPVLPHAVVPREQVIPRALDLAHEMADAPRETLVALKEMLTAVRRDALERALASEGPAQAALLGQEETRRRVGERYAFLANAGSGEAAER